MKYTVNEGQRALVFKDGKFIDYLKEGTYNNFGFFNKNFEVYDCDGQLKTKIRLDILLKNEKLKEEIDVVEVDEHELLLYYKDNKFSGAYYQGKYAFWKVFNVNDFRKIDLTQLFKVDTKLKSVFSQWTLNSSFDTVEVEDYNIVLYYRNGIFTDVFFEGEYAVSKKYYKNSFTKFDLRVPIVYNNTMKKMFDKYPELINSFDLKKVKEKELLIWSQNGIYKGKYLTGEYLFWNKLEKNEYDIIDLNIDSEMDKKYHNIMEKLTGIYTKFEIRDYETGLLIKNSQYEKTLAPGVYYFWKGTEEKELINIDLRLKQLDMQGQEILTRDKITLRLNFVTQYRVTDPLKNYKTINNLENQIYILLQIVLREYVGMQNLEQLLENKNEIAEFVLKRIKKEEDKYGVEFTEAGIKDIILPGDIKEILNTVLIAEKTALANTIKRREETASARSLLNTAKLMEENKTLYRLKEMEYIEKIVEKIGNIEISGNGNILEELAKIFSKK
jgi:regulator of protease activity HflC (stomatin/prohibitin superfamily)